MAKKKSTADTNQLPLIFDRKTETLIQANALTVAVYSMSSLQKNIFYMVQGQIRRDDPVDKRYVVRVKDIMELTGAVNPYKSLQDATEGMMQKIMNIPDRGRLLQVAPFSSVIYDYGEGTMSFRIDSDLRPFLVTIDTRQGNFTSFKQVPAIEMPGMYSKRIYEMLSQWKQAGLMKVSLLELKTRLMLYDPATQREQYMDWRDFNKRVLKIVVRDINDQSDLLVDVRPKRDGRKITELIWTIKRKQTIPVEPSPTAVELYQQLLVDFRQRPDQAERILAENDVATIFQKLYDIRVQKVNGKVSNIGAYTARTFGLL